MRISRLARALAALPIIACTASYGAQPRKSPKKTLTQKADKHFNDPCPQGKWWHISGDPCVPILCTRIPNDKEIPARCQVKHHHHPTALDPAADEGSPFTCHQEYSPYPETDVGRARERGDCPVCTDSAHARGRFGPLRRPKTGPQEETVTDEELAARRKNGIAVVDNYNPSVRKAFPGRVEKESRKVKLINGVYTVVPPNGR